MLTSKQVNQLSKIAQFIVLDYEKLLNTGVLTLQIFGIDGPTAMRLLINGTEPQKLEAITLYEAYLTTEQQKVVEKETAEKIAADEELEDIDNGDWGQPE